MVDGGRPGQVRGVDVVAGQQVRGGPGAGVRGDGVGRLPLGQVDRHRQVGAGRQREVQRVGDDLRADRDDRAGPAVEGHRPGGAGLDRADPGLPAGRQRHGDRGDRQRARRRRRWRSAAASVARRSRRARSAAAWCRPGPGSSAVNGGGGMLSGSVSCGIAAQVSTHRPAGGITPRRGENTVDPRTIFGALSMNGFILVLCGRLGWSPRTATGDAAAGAAGALF